MTDDPIGAIELMKSAAFKKAVSQVEADIMSEWKHSRVTAHVKREKLWMQLTALEAVKAKLQSIIDSAKL